MVRNRLAWTLAICGALGAGVSRGGQNESGAPDAVRRFEQLCSNCHGERGTGGDRGPALVDNRALRGRTESEIRDLIREGTPGGMPPFALPDPELQALARWIHSLNAPAYDLEPTGDLAAGERFFFGAGRCASCHMIAGRGKPNGPDLSDIGRQLTLADLDGAIDHPGAGTRSTADCPGWAWCPDEAWTRVRVRLRDGSVLRGYVRRRGKTDLQLQTVDGRLRFLRNDEYLEMVRDAEPPASRPAGGERRDLVAYLSRRGGVPVGPAPGLRESI